VEGNNQCIGAAKEKRKLHHLCATARANKFSTAFGSNNLRATTYTKTHSL